MINDLMKQQLEVMRTYRGWCLLSKLSINLSELLLPFECGIVSFSESQVRPFSWLSSAKVSGFSSSPNSKRCSISSLDMVLWTCCLSTTLAASPSFVTYWNHFHTSEKLINGRIEKWIEAKLICILYHLALVYFLFHSSMSQQSISKYWFFLPIPANMKSYLDFNGHLFVKWWKSFFVNDQLRNVDLLIFEDHSREKVKQLQTKGIFLFVNQAQARRVYH